MVDPAGALDTSGMAPAARAYLFLGVALIATHIAIGGNQGIYVGIGLASGSTVLLATAVRRPPNAIGWYGIGLAQLLYSFGDIEFFRTAGAFPSPADACYVASSVAYLSGLILLMGRAFPWRDWAGHIDAALVMAALGFSAWMLFLDHDQLQLGWTLDSVLTLFYPLADLLAIAVLLRILSAPGHRPAAFWLLLAALGPLLYADASYVIPSLESSYDFGRFLDAGWLGSYVLIATAALDPSMATVATTRAAVDPTPVRRVVIGAVALVVLPLSAVWELVFQDDSHVALVTAAVAVIVTGMAARAVLFVGEIDAQRQRAEDSERRFRMVFDRSPIGISVGRDGMMTETNPALQQMLGYTGDELAGMHYTQLTDADDGEVEARLAAAGERGPFAVDKRYQAKDGELRDVHVHLALDLDDGLGISLLEDVTERHALEQQLRDAQKLEAVGKLAGGIAHDFNNLMTAVLGYSDLLLKRLEDEDGNREKVEAIREAAARASELTRQLLAFGRRQVLNVADVDLCQVVEGMEQLLRHTVGSDVRIEVDLASEPVLVRADEAQLEQVVFNLAANAREAMPAGGTLSLRVQREPGSAVLTMADTGQGMDPETAAHVFEPFFTTKPRGQGPGLGLASVHGIVAQSGGTIEVETAPGSGSVFTVRLPLLGCRLPAPEARATLLTD